MPPITCSNLYLFPPCQRPPDALLRRNDITQTLGSFSTLLEVLTRTFLLESDLHPKHRKLLRAVEAHQASFTSLKRNLREARSEWCDRRIQSTSSAYDSTVDSLTRLAQHLSGLRSGTSLQHELAQAMRDGVLPAKIPAGQQATPPNRDVRQTAVGSSAESDAERPLAAAATMFGSLVDDVGPPMTALAVSLAYFSPA